MSEQINKVLASTAQSFTTAQQAQARANIGAMPQASASAFEPKITYAYDSDSAISSINGSAIGGQGGGIAEIYTDNNLTGSGTSGSPLGVENPILLSSNAHSSWYGSDGVDMSGTGSVQPYMNICASAISASATPATTVMRYSGITLSSGNVEGLLAPTILRFYNTASEYSAYIKDNYIGIDLNTGDEHWEYVSNVENTRHSVYESTPEIYHTTNHNWHGFSAYRGDNINNNICSSEQFYNCFKIYSATKYYEEGSAYSELKIEPTGISAEYHPSSGPSTTMYHICRTGLFLDDCNAFSIMPGVITWGDGNTPGYWHFQNSNGMFFIDMGNSAGKTTRYDSRGVQVTDTAQGVTASYGTALYKTLSSLSAWATAQGWTP